MAVGGGSRHARGMHRLVRSALPASLALALGCGSGGGDDAASDPNTSVSCAEDPRLDAYAGDLVKPGELGALSFHFFGFAPAEPSRGNNTFHVELRDGTGAAVSGDSSAPDPMGLSVNLLMPDHGHGTSVEPVVTFDAGSYTLSPLYLFMPGVWRIELDAQPSTTDEMLDRVVLHFCIEG